MSKASMGTFTSTEKAEPSKNNDLEMAQARDMAERRMNKNREDKLNPETNLSLRGCVGECDLDQDKSSDKFRVSTTLAEIDSKLRQDVKMVSKDGLMTSDQKTLMTSDLVEAAEAKFNKIVSDQQANMITQSKALGEELFTSNPKLSDLSAAIMGAVLPGLLDARVIDGKPTAGWQKHIQNEGMSDIINIANKHGLFPNGQNVSDSLNKQHSAEAFTGIRELMTEGEKLVNIARSQKSIFRTMKPRADTVAGIRQRAFKK